MRKILVISMLYPSSEHPHFGVFIKREVESLASQYSQKVIVPVPWHPLQGIKSLINSSILKENKVEVIHKRYFPLPGSFFQSVKGFWFFLFIVSLVRRIKKDFDFDLIHAHNVYPEGFCGYLLKKVFNKPLVVSSRGNDLHKLPDKILLRPMIKKVLTGADSIITVSNSLSKRAVSLGANQKKVSVMPKGVDTDIFRPMPKEEVRKKLGLPLGKTIVLSVGWLIPRKNPFSFTKILSSYNQAERERLLFVWVGEGPLRAELEKEISDKEFESNILLVGRKDPEEIATWMNASDIFMLVSFSEGMPNVLYEAMACGVPVIASNVDGAGEIIEHMKTGVLVSPDSYHDMVKAIVLLSDNPGLRFELGKHGLEYIKQKNLNWNENSKWLHRKYMKLFMPFIRVCNDHLSGSNQLNP